MAESLVDEVALWQRKGHPLTLSLFTLLQKLWTQGDIQLDFVLLYLGRRDKFLFSIYGDEHFRRANNTLLTLEEV